MIETFKKYINNFYTGNEDNDKAINLKYNHSLRVMNLMEKLSENINQDKQIAKITGLLHDYGRFYQYKTYKTFDDSKSIDHANYGVEELFKENQIEKYYKNKENYNKIKEAIYYHNKLNCPNNDLCKMIRDTDKLDILYLFTNNISLKEQGNISPKVKKQFQEETLIENKNIKTESDKILKHLAFVYDLNYIYSFKYLKENDIIEKIYQRIKNKEKFKDYFIKINNYIDEKLKEKIKC